MKDPPLSYPRHAPHCSNGEGGGGVEPSTTGVGDVLKPRGSVVGRGAGLGCRKGMVSRAGDEGRDGA